MGEKEALMANERIISPNAVWADFSITSIRGIAVLVPVGGVILALRMHPSNAHFHQLPEENVIGLLTGLIVIALFIERAVEVFLTPLRGTTCLKMTRQMNNEKDVRRKENPDSASELSDTERQLLDFKGQTRTIAYLIGLALGMAISASGVRGLSSLLDAKDCCAFFKALDVLLTGALLAGGADGLHRIATVFTSYMDKSAANAKSAQLENTNR
jgi:hypothetical protein